jgi:hypothetical protein
VKNGVVLHTVKEERHILNRMNGRKANWLGKVLRRNWLLKHVIVGKTEGRSDGKTRKKT